MFFIIGFFVSCAAAVAATCTAIFYYTETQRLNQVIADLRRAQELLAQGERAVRGAANNLAHEVAGHVDGLRAHAHQQQPHIARAIVQLDAQVNVVSNTAARLDEAAVELNNRMRSGNYGLRDLVGF